LCAINVITTHEENNMLLKITHPDYAIVLGCKEITQLDRWSWMVSTANTQDIKYVVMLLVKCGAAVLLSEL
jgi:hypothetical protein